MNASGNMLQRLVLALTASRALQSADGLAAPVAPPSAPRTADAVKGEFLHAWHSYERDAWGRDALMPLGKNLASRLGDQKTARQFLARSDYWRNVFNPAATPEGGYVQDRNADGTWPAFDPADNDTLRDGARAERQGVHRAVPAGVVGVARRPSARDGVEDARPEVGQRGRRRAAVVLDAPVRCP